MTNAGQSGSSAPQLSGAGRKRVAQLEAGDWQRKSVEAGREPARGVRRD